MELVIGLALEQHASLAGLQHLLQPLHAIAAGKEQQPPENLRRRRRDVCVVVVQPDAEVRIVKAGIELQRPLEGVLDLLAVAGRGESFTPKHAPLHERRIRTGEIEPRFAAVGLALCPPLACRDGLCREIAEPAIEPRALGRHLNLPPERDHAERCARLHRRRRAGLCELRVGSIELRCENARVDSGQPGRFGEGGGDGRRANEERTQHECCSRRSIDQVANTESVHLIISSSGH